MKFPHRITLKGGPFDGRVQFLLLPVPRVMMCSHRPRLGEVAVFHHYVQTSSDASLYAFERTDDTMLVSSPPCSEPPVRASLG